MEQIVLTPEFQTACDYALLEFAQRQPQAKDPSHGWDSHSQLVGAREVLEILKALHEPTTTKTGTREPSLNYKA